MTIFTELSIIVFITAIVSCFMRLFRQPLILGYIVSGIIVGPYVLNILHSTEYIELFSKIGISILLFIVGLSLNPMIIREVGKVSLLVGIGEVTLTAAAGFFIVRWFGYDTIPALFVAMALAFSSTIIILKLLTDKGDINKLYSKIAIGILLIEDIVATIVLLVVSTTAQAESSSGVVNLALSLLLKGLGVIIVLYLISRYILPRLSTFFASSQEFLFLFSLAWGLGLASLFYTLGFSIEIGALIAGVTLSLSPFAYEIGSRLRPLRDFFIIIFFIMLGSHMVWQNISALIYPALVLSAFVLIGRPLIVFFVMNILGYRRRLSFQTGLTLAQISEFSLILTTLALSLKYIDAEVMSLITLVGIITISGSTYLMLYADSIYKYLNWIFPIFEIRKNTTKGRTSKESDNDIIIFGYDRVGNDFVQVAEKLGKSYLVVDFNPQSIKRLQDNNVPFRYGDAEDIEFLQELGLDYAKLIISTVPDFKTNILIVQHYRRVNPTGIVIAISHDVEHARKLYLAGASYVVMPHYLGAHYAAQMISRHGFDHAEFERERNLHLAKLSKREA
ncbi:cation:proton antiporter [Candidatus Parcubacteria bacterium]|nr:cation:proton antiporter [Candidatus Parcubacteria bacterium]